MNTEAPVEMATQHKTCLVTIVQPGYPDSVIKITPAEHDKEKIWLDNRPGIERWEAVKLLMRRFSPPGKFVPDPVRWHNINPQDPSSIVTPVIAEADIPVCELQGTVFQPLPEEGHVSRPKEDAQAKMTARMDSMEHRIDSLIGAIEKLADVKSVGPVTEPAESKRGPGRPRKEV